MLDMMYLFIGQHFLTFIKEWCIKMQGLKEKKNLITCRFLPHLNSSLCIL